MRGERGRRRGRTRGFETNREEVTATERAREGEMLHGGGRGPLSLHLRLSVEARVIQSSYPGPFVCLLIDNQLIISVLSV